MPVKTRKTVASMIAARNRKFQKATKAEKRVLIAKDVIAQVKAKRFRPTVEVWVDPVSKSGSNIFLDSKFNEEDSVQKLFLSEKIPACECCALGAMFMSCTLYNNKTTASNFNQEMSWFEHLVQLGGFSNEMDKLFSKKQLMLIESVFEDNGGVFAAAGDFIANRWSTKYDTVEDRLVAIMKNIVRNKGTFRP